VTTAPHVLESQTHEILREISRAVEASGRSHAVPGDRGSLKMVGVGIYLPTPSLGRYGQSLRKYALDYVPGVVCAPARPLRRPHVT
jgi:hypothetical protein